MPGQLPGPQVAQASVDRGGDRAVRFRGDLTGELGAVVRRTRYGVPHVVADDVKSLAFGFAYAFAEDNICTLADAYVTVSAERSRYFGPDESWVFSGNGTENNNLFSDFFYKRINDGQVVEALIDQPPPEGPLPEIREGVEGFAAGYNRYLRDVGVDRIPDPRCRGEEWVREIEPIDVYRRFYQLASLASSGVGIEGIGGAEPLVGGSQPSAEERQAMLRGLGRRMRQGDIGSNAYGIGGDGSDNGRGVLLGNPHFPWRGAERLYQAQLTIPGRLDVAGATLYGVPLILIGHTDGLAWSHTVATAWRFTPFELRLVPGDPHSYFYDGEPRAMQARTVTVDVREPDGSISQRSRTLYETVHGPMITSLLGLPLFPWTHATGWALGDVNETNFRYLNHFFENNLAQNVREYHEIQERYQGIPWVNSIAADSRGEAYYSMNGAIPNVTEEHAQRCQSVLGLASFNLLGLPALDGSRSDCLWATDEDAVAPGILGNAKIPHLFRRDFVHNGNDSHWLANPFQPLEGYERIVGVERREITPRSRLGLLMAIERLQGADGLPGEGFDLDLMERVALGNRQYLGELWRDRLVEICRENPTIDGVDVREACEVLARWDLRDELDSSGAILFRRFASRAYPATASLPTGTTGSAQIGERAFSEPFDPADPINTPRGLRDSRSVRQALADAVRDLRGAGLPLDSPLRGVQFETAGGQQVPIHGGPGGLGVFNAINVAWDPERGYPGVPHGTSFLIAAQFRDGRCPVRTGTFVTYGQSEDEGSTRRTDYMRAFSEKRWNRVPYCEPEILASPELSTTYVGSSCTTLGGLRGALVQGTRGGDVQVRFARHVGNRVAVDVFRTSSAGRPHGPRLVRRLGIRERSFTWRPRRGELERGDYVVRLRIRAANGRVDVHRLGFRVSYGRVIRARRFDRSGAACNVLQDFRLDNPAFGGPRARPLTVRLRTDRRARVQVTLTRGSQAVARGTGVIAGERPRRLRVGARGLPQGTYQMRIAVAVPGQRPVRATLTARRL